MRKIGIAYKYEDAAAIASITSHFRNEWYQIELIVQENWLNTKRLPICDVILEMQNISSNFRIALHEKNKYIIPFRYDAIDEVKEQLSNKFLKPFVKNFLIENKSMIARFSLFWNYVKGDEICLDEVLNQIKAFKQDYEKANLYTTIGLMRKEGYIENNTFLGVDEKFVANLIHNGLNITDDLLLRAGIKKAKKEEIIQEEIKIKDDTASLKDLVKYTPDSEDLLIAISKLDAKLNSILEEERAVQISVDTLENKILDKMDTLLTEQQITQILGNVVAERNIKVDLIEKFADKLKSYSPQQIEKTLKFMEMYI